jgi:hypothetical protein
VTPPSGSVTNERFTIHVDAKIQGFYAENALLRAIVWEDLKLQDGRHILIEGCWHEQNSQSLKVVLSWLGAVG